jgi:hypothetical protein
MPENQVKGSGAPADAMADGEPAAQSIIRLFKVSFFPGDGNQQFSAEEKSGAS